MSIARTLVGLLLIISIGRVAAKDPEPPTTGTENRKVYILPIRDDIMPPMVYLVRRGVKAAMEAKAGTLILDMETNGGRLDSTKDVISILDEFEGLTVTYVNRDAYSAGAFIAVATQQIYMAPQSVIGAAAPILMGPGGGVEGLPDTVEVKMTSAVAARVRASAEKNGHNKEVVEAMINKTKELVIDGETLNKEGQILTLTSGEAAKAYGDPPRPLLSLGTFDDLDDLLSHLGLADAERVRIEPTGAERLASWLNAISPILLIIGIVGLYLEFKTPGFGAPGIAGIAAFALYFLGGYVAGLSGIEWIAVFVVGLILVGLELFVFTGTILVGLVGAAFMLVALLMAMVDVYPGTPALPTLGQVEFPLRQLVMALFGAALSVWLLSYWLPKTSVYDRMVSQSASGVISVHDKTELQTAQVGEIGFSLSILRPGGKAQFGDSILDVVSRGEVIPKGTPVKIIGHTAGDALVEPIEAEC